MERGSSSIAVRLWTSSAAARDSNLPKYGDLSRNEGFTRLSRFARQIGTRSISLVSRASFGLELGGTSGKAGAPTRVNVRTYAGVGAIPAHRDVHRRGRRRSWILQRTPSYRPLATLRTRFGAQCRENGRDPDGPMARVVQGPAGQGWRGSVFDRSWSQSRKRVWARRPQVEVPPRVWAGLLAGSVHVSGTSFGNRAVGSLSYFNGQRSR